MADRNKGTFAFAANFEVKLQGLLDPRGGVTKKSELISKETFPYDGDTIYMKEGMLVTVSETQEVYMLVSLANILAADYSGWKRIDAGAAKQVEVVDNLESDASDKALSANQGKKLQESISSLSLKVTSVYTPKGSVDTFDALPIVNQPGDVYNVVGAFELGGKKYPSGTNVVWTGSEWDALGGSVDLSNYATKDNVSEAVQTETDRATEEESRLAGLITSNTTLATEAKSLANDNKTALEQVSKNLGDLNLVLNGNDNDDDDIPNQIGLVGRLTAVETKNEAQDTRLTNLEKLVSGGEAGEGGATLLEMVNKNTADITALTARVKTNEENIATLTEVTGGHTTAIGELQDKVNAVEGTANTAKSGVDTLNSGSTTVGSVDYKIEQAFAWIDVE